MKEHTIKRTLSIILTVIMLLSLAPTGVFAAEDEGCRHVHDADCGYAEAAEAQNCTFEHEHDEVCGYIEAADGVECGSDDPECTHDADCGYVEAIEGAECSFVHEHDDECGYADAVDAAECQHVCDEECIASDTEAITILGFADCEGIDVESGTAIDDIELPEVVAAVISWEPYETLDIPVTDWECDDYDGDTDGFYVFTANVELPEGYALGEYAEAPYVCVTVGEYDPLELIMPLQDLSTALEFDSSTATVGTLGIDGYHWDSDTKTLTLQNFNLTVTTAMTALKFDFPASGSVVNLVLIGENSISNVGSTGNENVTTVSVGAQLVISGDGSLTVTAANSSANGSVAMSLGTTTIESGTITATAGTANTSGKNSIGITMSGALNITGGTLKAEAKNAGGSSVGINCSIYNLSITGGKMTAIGISRGINGSGSFTLNGATLKGGSADGSDLAVIDQASITQRQYISIEFPEPEPDETLYFGDGDEGWSLYTDSSLNTEYTDNAGKWTASANELTLDNFEYSTTAGIALEMPAQSTVVLAENSTNEVSTTSTVLNSTGIEATGALTISGGGSLEVTTADTTGTTAAIFADGKLSIDGADVSANAGDSGSNLSAGLYAYSDGIEIKNGATVAATGGTVSTVPGYGSGLLAKDSGDITVEDDCIVVAKGPTAAIYADGSVPDPTSTVLYATTNYDGTGLVDTDIDVANDNYYTVGGTIAQWVQIGGIIPMYGWYVGQSSPYTITTAAQLLGFANIVNGTAEGGSPAQDSFAGKTVKLGAHIDLSTVCGEDLGDSGTSWVPIGGITANINNSPRFTGTFDGNGYEVQNLYINTTISYRGLFGWVGESEVGAIKNLGVTGKVTTTDSYVGGIAARFSGTSIEKCYSTADIKGNTVVGGIVGNLNTGTVKNCFTTGKVHAVNTQAGGITGYLNSDCTVENCYSIGNVAGDGGSADVGGIVGVDFGGTVKNCIALGAEAKSASDSNVGRVIGTHETTTTMEGLRARSDMLVNNATVTGGLAANKDGLDAAPGFNLINLQDVFAAFGPSEDVNAIWYFNHDGSFAVGFDLPMLNGFKQYATYSAMYELYPQLPAAGTPATAPTITTTSLAGGTVGTAYSQTLTATGGSITWSIEAGSSLPAGLTLNTSTGVISGTPSAAGTSSFTVKATNSAGSATKALSIAISDGSTPPVNPPVDPPVNPSPTAPSIITASLPNGTTNTAYSQTLSASGTAPITWSISEGSLPAGLTMTEGGVISGTPTTEGTTSFAVMATNSVGNATRALSITIVKPSDPTDPTDPTHPPTPGDNLTGHPVPVTTSVQGTVTDGTLIVNIPDDVVQQAIENGDDRAEAGDKTEDGKSLRFSNKTRADNAEFVLSPEAIKMMVENDVQEVVFEWRNMRFTIDAATLQSIYAQGGGLRVVVTSFDGELDSDTQALIGNQPVWRIELVENTKSRSIIQLGKGEFRRAIKYAPAKDENPAYLYVVRIDENGKGTRVASSSYKDGWMTWAGGGTVFGIGYEEPKKSASDTSGSWASEATDYMVSRGYMRTFEDGLFRPGKTIAQKRLLETLAKMSGDKFPAKATFADYANWAFEKGIMSAAEYEADRPITRAKAAEIVSNYCKYKGYNLPRGRKPVSFTDTTNATVVQLQQAGIVNSRDNGAFQPNARITRAEFSAWMHRLIGLINDEDSIRGWATNDIGETQFYNNYGTMLTGAQTIGGVKYTFDQYGSLI